ncbi:MAG TPA: response regulator [Oligoflexus sp.]|uniref:response regulator n=1 Tax=Oligoflexus sp. TaxID=1971216 RepID=UPI002D7EC137|nr:response regulator [Oligoflexus sp.]HET9238052.1 response regulator [Oligoflexus sp.]
MSGELLSAEDMRRIRVEWRTEAEDRIRAAAAVLGRRARDEADAPLMKDLMRVLHSLKGTAAMVGFREVAEFVHQMEDYCEMFRGQNPVPFSHFSVELMEKALEELLEIVETADADHDPVVGSSAVRNELKTATEGLLREKELHFTEPELPPRSQDAIKWPVITALDELKKDLTICPSCPFIKESYRTLHSKHLSSDELEKQLTTLNSLKIEPCILLVDDEPGLTQVVGDLIKLILPRARLIEADTGAKALNLLSSVMGDQIDLVIVDLEIIDMSGLAVLRSLHELKSRSEVFANGMIMTAHKPSEQDLHEGLQLGVREFLLKPFGIDHLLTSLIGPIREAMMSRLLVSIVSYSQRVYMGFNRLEREPDVQLQIGIRREIHNMLTQMAKAQRSLQDAQMLPFC